MINLGVGLSVFLSPLSLEFCFLWKLNVRSETGTTWRKVGGPSCTHHDIVRIYDGTVAKLGSIVGKGIGGCAASPAWTVFQ